MTFYIELVCLSIEYDQFVESLIHHIISRKGAKSAKQNKDRLFKNLGVFAPLRENLL